MRRIEREEPGAATQAELVGCPSGTGTDTRTELERQQLLICRLVWINGV